MSRRFLSHNYGGLHTVHYVYITVSPVLLLWQAEAPLVGWWDKLVADVVAKGWHVSPPAFVKGWMGRIALLKT